MEIRPKMILEKSFVYKGVRFTCCRGRGGSAGRVTGSSQGSSTAREVLGTCPVLSLSFTLHLVGRAGRKRTRTVGAEERAAAAWQSDAPSAVSCCQSTVSGSTRHLA